MNVEVWRSKEEEDQRKKRVGENKKENKNWIVWWPAATRQGDKGGIIDWPSLEWRKSVLAWLDHLGMEAVDFGLTLPKPNDKKPTTEIWKGTGGRQRKKNTRASLDDFVAPGKNYPSWGFGELYHTLDCKTAFKRYIIYKLFKEILNSFPVRVWYWTKFGQYI
jgi:hypothetical protein